MYFYSGFIFLFACLWVFGKFVGFNWETIRVVRLLCIRIALDVYIRGQAGIIEFHFLFLLNNLFELICFVLWMKFMVYSSIWALSCGICEAQDCLIRRSFDIDVNFLFFLIAKFSPFEGIFRLFDPVSRRIHS